MSLTDAPPPAAGEGQAVVRLTRAAISPIDLLVLSGRLHPAAVLGQQFVGVVEEVNPARPEHARWTGKRVIASPYVPCGGCHTCRSGLAMHCFTRQVVGVAGRDGVFADRLVVPVRNLVEVPKAVSDENALFAYPLAQALAATQAVRLESKPFVTVLGDDVRALLAAQVMSRLNASVRLLGENAPRFGLCERWRIKHRHVSEVGRRQDQDVVFETTGNPAFLELAFRLVRPRGSVSLLHAAAGVPAPAFTPHAAPLDLSLLIANEIRLLGTPAGSLAEALTVLEAGGVDASCLNGRRFKLHDAAAAFDAASAPDALTVTLEP